MNPDVSKNAKEDIWSAGGLLPYLPSAMQLEVKSTSGNDSLSGTAAQKIKIFGLDENFLEIEEELNLNGIANVLTVNYYLRIYRLEVTSVGTSGTNNGTITVKNGNDLIAQIDPGLGRSLMTHYTIPADKTGYLFSYWTNTVRVDGLDPTVGELFLFSRPFDGMFRIERHYQIFPSDLAHASPMIPYIPIEPKSDIVVRAIGVNNAIKVSAGYSLLLVDNKFLQ